ncbi:hypothetical protein BJ165DRAFT_333217 [Panaeolus papilionaceus]|nr:hypothetical protein BJ165DRAFT_333217 [Panaeolus papilionaceus]
MGMANLIRTDKVPGMVRSMLQDYQQSDWLPIRQTPSRPISWLAREFESRAVAGVEVCM